MKSEPEQPQQHLIVGTRTSRLARWQSTHVINLLSSAWPLLTCELRPFETKGDRTLDRPLPEIGGKGLFTAELERALLSGEIDIAVHSLKDLPVQNPPGLALGAIPARADVSDVLVTPGKDTITTLPPGAVVGTSSLRRQAQILAARPDLRVRSIRGNVETRVRKVLDGEYDAAVLAAAGLKRLDMDDVIGSHLPPDVMLPAPGQGALAVQCRADDEQTLALLRPIDHAPTRRATTAERQFLKALGGGCSAPIAAHACSHDDGMLQLEGLIASPDGGLLIRVSGRGHDPHELALQVASEARERGAAPILASLQSTGPRATTRPLQDLRVVVTRASHQASQFADRLRQAGATPILFPTIRIVPFDDSRQLDTAIQALQDYDWVIFTSVNGVEIFWARVQALHLDAALLDGVHVSAIGPATAGALKQFGVQPDFVPDEFIAERVAEGLGDVCGQKILLPRAELARAALAELLREGGAQVDEIPTYRTVQAATDPQARAGLDSADVITFTSSSTVRNFVALVGGTRQAASLASNALIACIGPITAATVREMGMEPHIIAEDYTIDGLLSALQSHFQ